MVGRRIYDLMYRYWAPWDATGVREDLRALLSSEQVSPETHARAVDMGCGTGANVVHLAGQGYEVTGIDFSPVALRAARERAAGAGVLDRCTFVEADLTDPATARRLGRFDLLLDFGTLDDLKGPARAAMARNVAAMARPGAQALVWCFYARRDDLPLISFHGPSRLAPAIEPGEPEALFGQSFEVLPYRQDHWLDHTACFLLTRT